MAKKTKKENKREATGGISFFFSYFVLFFLSLANIPVLYKTIFISDLYLLTLLISGASVGWWAGYTFFRGQTSVLIHEYKHAILATFVGNRWKRLKLKGMGGSFQYSYTKSTAGYNAFISLAPYFLPVLTLFGLIIFALIKHRSMEAALTILGVLHGAELYFNLKDATPIQTDLTGIVGGYYVALGYIAVANIFITSTLIIGTVGGVEGLELLWTSLWNLAFLLVATIRAIFIHD